MDKVSARLDDCSTRSDSAVGLDAKNEFSVLENQHTVNRGNE